MYMCIYTYLYAFIAFCFSEHQINHKPCFLVQMAKWKNQIHLEFGLGCILNADQQTIETRNLLPASSAWQEQADIS